jgi:hypothetical protein
LLSILPSLLFTATWCGLTTVQLAKPAANTAKNRIFFMSLSFKALAKDYAIKAYLRSLIH